MVESATRLKKFEGSDPALASHLYSNRGLVFWVDRISNVSLYQVPLGGSTSLVFHSKTDVLSLRLEEKFIRIAVVAQR